MNTNRNTLALRRYSIRTLTHNELSVVHGGQGNGTGTGNGTCTHSHRTTRPTRTKLA